MSYSPSSVSKQLLVYCNYAWDPLLVFVGKYLETADQLSLIFAKNEEKRLSIEERRQKTGTALYQVRDFC